MQRISSKDTKPELRERRLLHALGYRYRAHVKELTGKPDIAFARRRKIIFVHGCFWHSHKAEGCPDGSRRRSNTSYCRPELDRNAQRDHESTAVLKARGWQVLTVWACETLTEAPLRCRLVAFLGEPVAETAKRSQQG